MKRFDKPAALILIGALLLTACNNVQETPADETAESGAQSLVTEPSPSESSGSDNFNGTTGGKHLTSGLTESGSGYEGIEGTGKFNYGEALQKSLLFYELHSRYVCR